jgi:aminoglycoside phosphotransferase family enzyme
MLSALLLHDAVDSECLTAIAKKLAAFHAGAPSDKAAIYGSPQTIAANLRENFRATGHSSIARLPDLPSRP